jgi:ribosomal protein S1
MAKKTFYININKQSFNNVQALNKESSSKSFIRTLLKNKGEIKITDNNSKLSTTFVKEPIQAGRLLNTPEFFLKNKFNKDLRLRTSIGEKQFNKPLINKYKKTFENSIKIRNFNKKEPAIILESVKGGFYVYYAGVCGFLPQSQY